MMISLVLCLVEIMMSDAALNVLLADIGMHPVGEK